MSSTYTFVKFVDSVTYKPGYKFKAQVPINLDQVVVFVYAKVPDANDPGRESQVYQSRAYSGHIIDSTGPEVWMQLIHELVCDLEMHEVDEWLKVNGVHVRDPHPASV